MLTKGRLQLRILRAQQLRSADWFSKNDVYVQVYVAPEGERFSRTTFTVCPRLPSTLPQLLAPLQAPERNKTVFKPCYLPPFCCHEDWCAAPTQLPAPHKAPGCLPCLTGAYGYLAAARASS